MSKDPYKIFSVLMNLEGSIQLYNSANQVYRKNKGRKQEYFRWSINYHKGRIEVFAKSINIEGTPEEISSKDIPIIKELLNYPPYLQYLGINKQKRVKHHEKEIPFYI